MDPRIRIIQGRWPLASLARHLGDQAFEAIAADLRLLTGPCFGLVESGQTWIGYYPEVLTSFEKALASTIAIPPSLGLPRLFAGHALLGAIIEQLFGPAVASQAVPAIGSDGIGFLIDLAEEERWPLDMRTLRQALVSVSCELLFQARNIVTVSDEGAKRSFLRAAFSALEESGEDFPQRELFRAFLGRLQQTIVSGKGEPSALVNELEALLLKPGSAQRLVLESSLDRKPRLKEAAARILKRLEPPRASADRLFVSDVAPKGPTAALGPTSRTLELPPHLGPYLLEKKLGEGGMGTVFLGRRPGGQRVAIKILHEFLKEEVTEILRFGREVEIVLQLKHPHIVEALDYGVSEGRAYLALEYMEGGSLQDRLDDQQILEEGETWTIVRQVTNALDYAWNQPKKYMHRDLKADNILFDERGRAKLGDFGLAAGTALDATRLTSPDEMVGTPLYMSPEQIMEPSQTDIRTDLWAIGVLAYRCLSGRYPFIAASPMEIFSKICAEEPEDVDEALSELSERSRETILKLLAKDPKERFQSPQELLEHLRAAPMMNPAVSADVQQTLDISNVGISRERARPGQVFGAYTIERELGRGGMGVVYLARARSDGSRVVIKFLQGAEDLRLRIRFLREARLLQAVSHPNVVRLFEVQEAGDNPYIVMEALEGPSLEDLVQQRGPLPFMDAARIIRDLARALAQAHERTVIHRDVKPANIVLTAEGPKLIDFGLATSDDDEDNITLAGQAIGTAHYMAPEQWGEHKVDARCDIFALGATFYTLATGVLAFPGEDRLEIARRMIEGPPASPRDFAPDLPEALERVMMRMLEPDRAFRYPRAELVAEDLERAVTGRPIRIPCLVEKESDRRHPLMPGRRFVLGRGSTASIIVEAPAVSRNHAEIERGPSGFSIRDLESSAGTFVGDKLRLRPGRWVQLKDGDEVGLGQVRLRFEDGGVAETIQKWVGESGSGRAPITAAPPPFIEALTKALDKRVVLQLIERLAPDYEARRLAEARALLDGLVDEDSAGRAETELAKRLKKSRRTAETQLFIISHEKHGEDIAGWLKWWNDIRDRYPPQLAPRERRSGASLVILRKADDDLESWRRFRGDASQGKEVTSFGHTADSIPEGYRTIPLDDLTAATVGRDQDCDVVLSSRSVSRHHVTLLRFHNRVAVGDAGSRFGTLVNGERVDFAFLGAFDKLTLGKVDLMFHETAEAPKRAEGAPHILDPELFFVLASLRHPGVAPALIELLDEESLRPWIAARAATLAETESAGGSLIERVEGIYERRRRKARGALAAMLGGDPEQSPEDWRARLDDNEDAPTIRPGGWLPDPI